jgi:hypothetical protein
VILWALGTALLAVAIWQVRAPFGQMSELDRLAENARRYESWRGGRSSGPGEKTGADVMRALLRRRVLTWTAVGLVGVVLIVAGFAIR